MPKSLRSIVKLARTHSLGLWTAAGLTSAMGIVNLLSAIYPSLPDRRGLLEAFFPFYLRSGSRIFAALAGFMLLTLAANLLRRKRLAWGLTIGLLMISIVSHLIKGLDFEECILAMVLLVQLVAMRSSFTAQSDRPSIAQGIRILLLSLLFTLAYGTVGFYVLDGHFKINDQPTNFGWIQAILQTLAMFLTEDNAGLQPTGRYAEHFANSIYVIGAGTLGYAFLMLLRPVLLKANPALAQERHRARQIIDAHGQTSLARLALLPDKAYYFSPTGQSVIAYVPKGHAAIALGDPIGPEADREETILSFWEFCRRNDWFPVFYEVLPQQLPLYQRLGLQSLQIGEEAIVHLPTFSLSGKANQNLRTAVNRLTKTGHRFAIYEPPIADSLLQQLKVVSDEWLRHKNGSEKRFSIAWFDVEHLRPCYIGTVYSRNGEIIAFVNLLSGYHASEVTVDLMRHRAEVENGTMEFLFVSLIQHFQQLGYQGFSFSLSPLAGVGQSQQSRQLEKGLNYFFEHLNQFYNFKGLHQFKDKFRPDWKPRYLIYPSRRLLPEIAVGLVRVDSGDRLLDYFKPGT